jgi:hypothetical protein
MIRYADRKTMDTLPALGCDRWFTYYSFVNHSYTLDDTLYFLPNRSYNNLQTQLYIQDAAPDWTLFDLNSLYSFPNCRSTYFLDARMPPLSSGSFHVGPFIYQASSSRDGVMIYKLAASGLKSYFEGKKIKVQLQVEDKAGNISNVIETQELQVN